MDGLVSRRTVVKGIVAGVPLAAILADPKLARAVPAKTPAPAVLVVHEWWGLNDQIKAVAAELADNGFLALAIDLFGGKVPANEDEAAQLSQSVGANPDAAIDTLKSWIAWLK